MYEPLTAWINELDLEHRLQTANGVVTHPVQAHGARFLRTAQLRFGNALILAGMRLGGRYTRVNDLEPSAYRSHG